MQKFMVVNEEADVCYLVEAGSKKLAKDKVIMLVNDLKHNEELDLGSFQRLRDLTVKKHCGLHVLLSVNEVDCPFDGFITFNG